MTHKACRFAPFLRQRSQELISDSLLRPEKGCRAQRSYPKNPGEKPFTCLPLMLLSFFLSDLVAHQTPWEAESRNPHTSAGPPLSSASNSTVEKRSWGEDGLVLGHSAKKPKTKGVSMSHGHLEAHQRTDAVMGLTIRTEPA